MNARPMMLLAATMAIAAFAAGCGGGGGDSSDATTVTTSSLSKPAFVKKVNAICEQGRTKVLATETLPEGIETTMVPAYEGIVEEVRALGAPSGDEAEVEAFLNAMQDDASALNENSASISSFAETEKYFKSSAALARKNGLSKCTFYAYFGPKGT